MSESTLESINCLSCRHCAMLPETDFSQSLTVIRCGKTGQRQTPIIANDCGLADARYEYRGKIRIGGDRIRNWTPAADAYLRAFYDRHSMEQLCAALRRKANGIYHRAHRLKLTNGVRQRVTSQMQMNGIHRKRTRRQLWTAEQMEYLKARFRRPDWPEYFTRRGTPEYAAKQAERARIVAEIARRGPARTWARIGNQAWLHFTPNGRAYYQRKKEQAIAIARERRRAKRRQTTAEVAA